MRTTMEGGGYYNRHSESQGSAAAFAIPLLEAAVAGAGEPAAGPLWIADYGSSQGHNSMAPMAAAIDAARRRLGRREVVVVHTDQPGNDFASLFTEVAEGAASYRRGREDVLTLAAGRSFHERLLPAGQVWIGWSAFAVHWLSAAPAVRTPSVWTQRARGDARAALASRAAADWEAFLTARAEELAPGGRLLVFGSVRDDRDRIGAEGVVAALDDALAGMAADGVLTAQEHARLLIPTWYRTTTELSAPLAGPLAGRLEAVGIDVATLEDPIWAAFERDGDADAYADGMLGFLRAVFDPVLSAQLAEGRPADAVTGILVDLHDRLRERLRDDPQGTRFAWLVAALTLARTGA